MPSEKKLPTSIAIGPVTHESLRKFCGETRVIKGVVAQVLGWFTSQDERVQRVVMGEVTKGMEEAYAEALEALAAEVRAGKGKTSKRG